MIKKILLLFFLLNIFNYSNAEIESLIINNFKKINNMSFNFKQTINNKNEEGNCIIQFPKKIYCEYSNLKKKLIVSNGESLVIKNQVGKEYFSYPLEQTPFALILNKNLLLKKIERLNAKFLDEKYYLFIQEKRRNTACLC